MAPHGPGLGGMGAPQPPPPEAAVGTRLARRKTPTAQSFPGRMPPEKRDAFTETAPEFSVLPLCPCPRSKTCHCKWPRPRQAADLAISAAAGLLNPKRDLADTAGRGSAGKGLRPGGARHHRPAHGQWVQGLGEPCSWKKPKSLPKPPVYSWAHREMQQPTPGHTARALSGSSPVCLVPGSVPGAQPGLGHEPHRMGTHLQHPVPLKTPCGIVIQGVEPPDICGLGKSRF